MVQRKEGGVFLEFDADGPSLFFCLFVRLVGLDSTARKWREREYIEGVGREDVEGSDAGKSVVVMVLVKSLGEREREEGKGIGGK